MDMFTIVQLCLKTIVRAPPLCILSQVLPAVVMRDKKILILSTGEMMTANKNCFSVHMGHDFYCKTDWWGTGFTAV